MVETSCQLVEYALDQVLPHIQFDTLPVGRHLLQSRPIVNPRWFKRVIPTLQAHPREAQSHGIDIWWIDCDGDVRPISAHDGRGSDLPVPL